MEGLIIFLFLLWFCAFGTATAAIAKYKGRDPVLWFVIGAAFGFIGLIIAACMPDLLPGEPRAAASAPASQPTSSSADEITKLAGLHARGLLTDEEFRAAKAKVLGA